MIKFKNYKCERKLKEKNTLKTATLRLKLF